MRERNSRVWNRFCSLETFLFSGTSFVAFGSSNRSTNIIIDLYERWTGLLVQEEKEQFLSWRSEIHNMHLPIPNLGLPNPNA